MQHNQDCIIHSTGTSILDFHFCTVSEQIFANYFLDSLLDTILSTEYSTVALRNRKHFYEVYWTPILSIKSLTIINLPPLSVTNIFLRSLLDAYTKYKSLKINLPPVSATENIFTKSSGRRY